VLADELVTCDATGLTVLADQTRICPVSNRPVLERALATCSMCRQRVSPKTIVKGRCLACRSTRPIAKDEPLLAPLLETHKGLQGWANWALSETAEVFILLAAGWWKRLLLVVDKESREVRYAAQGQRFPGGFSAINVSEIDADATR